MKNKVDHYYLAHADTILFGGTKKADRTGVGTMSWFGHQMWIDLRQGFPILTTKKVHFHSVVVELLWFLRGDTNIQFLKDHNVTIWDEWANEDGDLGPIYGKQWRSWSNYEPFGEGGEAAIRLHPVDQIANVIDTLNHAPDSRRMIVSAWNVTDLPDMALEPCHVLFQFYTEEIDLGDRIRLGKEIGINVGDLAQVVDAKAAHECLDTYDVPRRWLDCQLYQRSADWFLGVPFNVCSYALLTHMVARVANMVPRRFVHSFGDTHIYLNHIEQIKEQQKRAPRQLPKLILGHSHPKLGIDGFEISDFVLDGYNPHPAIKAPVAV